MNTTEDGQPVGENPGGVMGILAAADKITATAQLAERQGQALNEVMVLHAQDGDWCDGCDRAYPCETVNILDRLGL